jgi:hypothetical protein
LVEAHANVYAELWTSLASLLRSYTAVHGLGRGHAHLTDRIVEWDGAHILARFQNKWLELRRQGARVSWMRENGNSGVLELTGAGRLRGADGEEDLDMAAEAWARELMQ